MQWYSVDEDDSTTVDRLSAAWIDAPTENLETLAMLVDVARDQVWAYAPESEDDDSEPVDVPAADDDTVPSRLVLAQLRQVQALWDAGRVSSSGDVGMDGYVYTPRPLDKAIRAIIRPMKGRFSVG